MAPAQGKPYWDVPGDVWDRLAACESRQNPTENTGNGFEGEYQFLQSTWLANGGGRFTQHAYLATDAQQRQIAEHLEGRDGWSPWPGCRLKLGLP